MSSNRSILILENERICTLLANRLEELLQKEHLQVRYFHQLSQSYTSKCSQKFPNWLSKIHLWPCRVKERCVSDMAASVTMALHMMQIELLENLRQGNGINHPMALILLDRTDKSHDEIMQAMRRELYANESLVQEGLLHHEIESKVRMDCTFIERWIANHRKGIELGH